jgi:hypothetical protein
MGKYLLLSIDDSCYFILLFILSFYLVILFIFLLNKPQGLVLPSIDNKRYFPIFPCVVGLIGY